MTVDLDRLSASSLKVLDKHVHSSGDCLRYRHLGDLLYDWPLMQTLHCVECGGENDDTKCLVHDVWEWIHDRWDEKARREPLESLRLIPLRHGLLRKLKPDERLPVTLIYHGDEKLENLALCLASRDPGSSPGLFDSSYLSHQAIGLIKTWASEPLLKLALGDDLGGLVSWLYSSKHLFRAFDLEQDHTLELIDAAIRRSSRQTSALVKARLRQLPIFRKATTKIENNIPSLGYEWTSLVEDTTYVAIGMLPVAPPARDVTFIDISYPSTSSIVEELDGAVSRLSLKQLVNQYVLPALNHQVPNISTAVKDVLIDFIFEHCVRSKAWKIAIDSLPIVPLSRFPDAEKRYACPRDIISPNATSLRSLYFEDEDVHPDSEFFARYQNWLAGNGIRTALTKQIVLERVAFYSTCGRPQVEEKIRSLLQLKCPEEMLIDETSQRDLRQFFWLPVKQPTVPEGFKLIRSHECRGKDQESLVSHVLGVLDFPIDPTWVLPLGWDKPIEPKLILKQLELSIAAKQEADVDKIISYMESDARIDVYADLLKERQCILGSSSRYFLPRHTFLAEKDYTRYDIAPHLDDVDRHFSLVHPKLLKRLGIRNRPTLEDLFELQEKLSKIGPLGERDLQVFIKLVTMMVKDHPRATRGARDALTDLMIPDEQGMLVPLSQLTHGDPSLLGETDGTKFVHSAIPASLAKDLQIDGIREACIRGQLALHDDDGDEYIQQESITTVISNTLERYPIQTTFSEYLANAEDCGCATNVTWLLDNEQHAQTELLSEGLAISQGAAIFVHNDGVFSDKDFAGFKNIGKGSKRDDAGAIGMFGRGAITAYHFTDTPMLISGKYLVILDPQQELLPKRKSGSSRMQGLKLPLKSVREYSRDQLAPFSGLFGFKDEDYYNGTLFRFPLRKAGSVTHLTERTEHIGPASARRELEEYFPTARQSLLFLRNICQISFRIRGEDCPIWSTKVGREMKLSNFISPVYLDYSGGIEGRKAQGTEKWYVAIQDLDNVPEGIAPPFRRAQKFTECGVAACVSLPGKPQRVFCTLPMPFSTALPVSIHGSFMITGDRQTIPINDSARRDESKWNQWLLKSCIPRLYLSLLEQLARSFPDSIYRNFWPTKIWKAEDQYSETVRTAFWEILAEASSFNLQLFPVKVPEIVINPLLARSKTRRPVQVATLRTAEFLNSHRSTIRLEVLLRELCNSFVPLPLGMAAQLTAAISAAKGTWIDGLYLCQTFKGEDACQILQIRRAADKELLPDLLEYILTENLKRATIEGKGYDDQSYFTRLVGCRILPLRNGALGTIADASGSTDTFFLASEDDYQVFDFAPEKFVDQKALYIGAENRTPKQIKGLLNSKKINVRPLSISDLGALMRLPKSPMLESSESRRLWLPKFWSLFNKALEKEIQSGSAKATLHEYLVRYNLFDLPIYPAKRGTEALHICPATINDSPCVFEPNDHDQSILCRRISGLIIIDRELLPSFLMEETLFSSESLGRFVRSCLALARKDEIALEDFLRKQLDKFDPKMLQGIVLHYLESEPTRALYTELREMPIWPLHIGGDIRYITARKLLACESARILLPWTEHLDRFMDPVYAVNHFAQLEKLGLVFLSTASIVDRNLELQPSYLAPENEDIYHDYIHHLFTQGFGELYGARVAPTRDGCLRSIEHIYDHHDAVFTAAFRKEKSSHFIHQKFCDLYRFWCESGLRRRDGHGSFTEGAYLECIEALARRMMEEAAQSDYLADAQTVLSHLRWDNHSIHDWKSDTWDLIASSPIFPARTDFSSERSYRRDRMLAIASKYWVWSLDESIQSKHSRVSWSQAPTLEIEPCDYVYSKVSNQGAPSTKQVWEHLRYLISLFNEDETTRTYVSSDLQEILKDVQASYSFLQKSSDLLTSIPGAKQAKVWLNLSTTDLSSVGIKHVKESLTAIEHLCLHTPVDALPIRYVRPFLAPYEMLLRALGCASVYRPDISLPSGNETRFSEPSATATMAKLARQRETGNYCDAIFSVSGKIIYAHRSILAIYSPYCDAQFSGPWSANLDTGVPIELEDMTANSLEAIVAWAYTNHIDWPVLSDANDNESIATSLDFLLDLLVDTDRLLVSALHEKVEQHILRHATVYVRPDNVQDIRIVAQMHQAKMLKSYCEEFEARNRKLVDMLQDLSL
ncbi:MAG: hypothetical protein M1819_005660 [Sarea resinae]|nr:MAG: hypothetical protein M1819_005660 [Sarea resinae]